MHDNQTLTIQTHVDLAVKHTFALKATAAYYVAVGSELELQAAIAFAEEQHLPVCLLGEGSNQLFAETYNGLVINMAIKGIHCLEESNDSVIIRAQAGELWDGFLQVCMQNQWHGLDNLAIIPGTVGAAPVQNIGAYGQEVSNAIVAVHGVNLKTKTTESLTHAQCQFAYRDSVFKQRLKNQFIITAVDFCFNKQATPLISYAPLKQQFNNQSPDFLAVRHAVIRLRQAKLPIPSKLPNAGSFFKNPVVSPELSDRLCQKYPAMPSFPQANGAKLSAGWLIEQAGLKGKQLGPVAVYDKHALVLINQGGATLADVLVLKALIVDAVHKKFGVTLEQEPLIVDQDNSLQIKAG
ncbi:MAG: UDP-N-acetylmuramate dehydrogenase [Cellvibrionales bacterium]|nr:UDP-N-acetylmuramate dehydrogenase [Cellvibrionales bacterium]